LNFAPTRLGPAEATPFPLPFSMAFQPIVAPETRTVFAYEALVRGTEGQGAGQVLAQLSASNRHDFDDGVRRVALELAGRLGLARTGAGISINILPSAVFDPEACAFAAAEAAQAAALDPSQVVLEFTETDRADPAHLQRVIAAARAAGLKTAIDDFGAGWSGLSLLARFQPDIVKLDMALTRGIEGCRVRRAIVRGVVGMAEELGLVLVAEGVETIAEARAAQALGVGLMQGYLFARPAFEALPAPFFGPVLAAASDSASTTAG
jgi:EAL domain-containing protein (putative c-di-GMP-specific phosphodiesterase class I)